MKDVPYIANISLLCDYLRRPAPYYNPVAAGDASVGWVPASFSPGDVLIYKLSVAEFYTTITIKQRKSHTTSIKRAINRLIQYQWDYPAVNLLHKVKGRPASLNIYDRDVWVVVAPWQVSELCDPFSSAVTMLQHLPTK